MSTFRRYIKGDSLGNIIDVNLQDINPNVKDYHIVLAFATDYDDQGNHCNGGFTFNGDLKKIIQALSKFESENQNVDIKLFISIGSRDSKFAFKAKGSWVSWATDSLKIVIGYLKDLGRIKIGIDVFYETINTADVFASWVGDLIRNLKRSQIITCASITASADTMDQYTALFQNCGASIDWIVYQFYKDTIPTPDQFIARYDFLSVSFPRGKLLAGYSTKKDDWETIKPNVFFQGVNSARCGEVPAVSIWDVDELVSNGWAILPFRAVVAPGTT